MMDIVEACFLVTTVTCLLAMAVLSALWLEIAVIGSARGKAWSAGALFRPASPPKRQTAQGAPQGVTKGRDDLPRYRRGEP